MCPACGSYSVPKRARFCPNCGSRQDGNDNDASSSDNAIPMVPAVPIGDTMSAGSHTTTSGYSNSGQGTTGAPPVHVTAVSVPEITSAVTTSSTSLPTPQASASVTTPTDSSHHHYSGTNNNDTPTTASTATARAMSNPPTAPANNTSTNEAQTSSTTEAPRVPTYAKPNFGNDNEYDNVHGNTAMFWKNPTEIMLERASSYQAMGGILFIGASGCTKGKFTLPKTIHCGQILTGNKLDLSIADFVHPVTTILVGTILGGFKLIVPRGVRVETQGFGILGGFKGLRSQTVHAGEVDNAPLIVLQGAAILGGAKVVVNDSVPPVQVIS